MSSEELPEAYALIVNQIQDIMKAISTDDPYTALTETDLLLKTINVKDYPSANELQKKIDSFLLDKTNNRILRLNSVTKREIETHIEYLDKDIGQDHRLFYQKELEEDLISLYGEIRTFLANIIKKKLSENFEF